MNDFEKEFRGWKWGDQRKAFIRMCASCCGVYTRLIHKTGCPYCGFACYGAYWVIGSWFKVWYQLIWHELTKKRRAWK